VDHIPTNPSTPNSDLLNTYMFTKAFLDRTEQPQKANFTGWVTRSSFELTYLSLFMLPPAPDWMERQKPDMLEGIDLPQEQCQFETRWNHFI